MQEDVIVAQDLTKYYGRSRGVLGLSFTVRRGEVFGFLGPNGAGKTTTIRLLLDFIRPTSGRVFLFGLDSRVDGAQIKRRVGYLAGELSLYEGLTGRRLLQYFAHLRGGVQWQKVEALAARLDCDLSSPIKNLSQGNKRKVGLLQALMHEPELLVLDEPTNGLDPLVQQEFYGLVAEAKARGATIFLSSHNLPEVERICDRVGVVREGKLVAIEEVAALKGRAFRTVEVHFAGAAPCEPFEGLPGVRLLSCHGNTLRCQVEGSMDALVKALAQFTVLDIRTHEPSLEEIFLAYYGGGTENAA
jgi:ABC-2 type transport system ATP-binding protein